MLKNLEPLNLRNDDIPDEIGVDDSGILVSVSGIDGSGKTTLTHNVRDILENNNVRCSIFKHHPGLDSLYWQTVMELKSEMKEEGTPIPDDMDQFLHVLELLTHSSKLLPKYLERNDVVFADRYILDKIVYARLFTKRVDSYSEKLLRACYKKGRLPTPHAAIYLENPVRVSIKRLYGREGPKEEKESREMLIKAKKLYESLLENPLYTKNLVRLDASMNKMELAKNAVNSILSKVKKSVIVKE